jgi:hypothetical protein
VQFRKGQRKDTVMAEYLGKFHQQEGVVAALAEKERRMLAETAAHRRGLHGTFASYRENGRWRSPISTPPANLSEWPRPSVPRASDTEEENREMEEDEAMTRRALEARAATTGTRPCSRRYDTRDWWALVTDDGR